MRTKELWAFIKERHNIHTRRTRGDKKPWTLDKILQQYRFCNVYRELDTVTAWIAKNWRFPHRSDPNLWFAMVAARLLNWPETMQALGYPAPWRKDNFLSVLEGRSARGQQVFNSAYIVSTNGHKMPKPLYLATKVLDPLWEDRFNIHNVIQSRATTLADVHKVLMRYDGLGSFMAAQVIADLKYVKPLSKANDWGVWAASGPGSRRGLNRVMDRPVNTPWREVDWLGNLHLLHTEIGGFQLHAGFPPLHAQDLQNCLCEFDKYERTRLGEGRPRNTYEGV